MKKIALGTDHAGFRMKEAITAHLQTIGYEVLDFGTDRLGTFAGGLALSRICLADLADVSIVPSPWSDLPLPLLQVVTDFPLESCIGSQYAGWPFSTESFFAMGSGPARGKRGQEEILTEYQLTVENWDQEDPCTVAIFETNRNPTPDDLDELANQCGCSHPL